jgi:uncharacterized repeat protein (TIGR03803 family)
MTNFSAFFLRHIQRAVLHFSSRSFRHSLAALAVATLLTGQAHASPALTALENFDGSDGWFPASSLIADADGNLFGTTSLNGNSESSYGTVFEVEKQCRLRTLRGACILYGYASTPTVLVTFNGANGAQPNGPLLADASGNLYGTTQSGGANNLGTVFEVVKPSGGWTAGLTPTVLVSFNDADGENPSGGLIADADGNLFGTTGEGGPNSYGTVFELPAQCKLRLSPSGECFIWGYASTPTILVGFNGTNGAGPGGNLLADADGNLYGAAGYGGPGFSIMDIGNGTVFEVVKPSGGWTANLSPTTLVNFDGTNGAAPLGSLIADAEGNLFGVTVTGGIGYTTPDETGYGTVFEIAKCANNVQSVNCAGGYSSVPTTLFSFDVTHGDIPGGGLIADANGNLFGTTVWGGANSGGTAYEIVKPAGGWTANLTSTVLASFENSSGYGLHGGLLPDGSGNLYGTASFGGTYSDGTVYEISGSGYQP